jgi:hypothetical protein
VHGALGTAADTRASARIICIRSFELASLSVAEIVGVCSLIPLPSVNLPEKLSRLLFSFLLSFFFFFFLSSVEMQARGRSTDDSLMNIDYRSSDSWSSAPPVRRSIWNAGAKRSPKSLADSGIFRVVIKTKRD